MFVIGLEINLNPTFSKISQAYVSKMSPKEEKKTVEIFEASVISRGRTRNSRIWANLVPDFQGWDICKIIRGLLEHCAPSLTMVQAKQ